MRTAFRPPFSLNYIDELEVKVNPEDYDQAMALINQKD